MMVYVWEQRLDSDGEPIEESDHESELMFGTKRDPNPNDPDAIPQLLEPDEWDLEIAKDGFPRYYMRKPPGPVDVYAKPIPNDVMLREIRLYLEPEWKKTARTVWWFVLWISMKLLDIIIAKTFFSSIPRFLRLLLLMNTMYHRKEYCEQMVLRPPKPWMMRFTAFTIKMVYYPLIVVIFCFIFFAFDDKIQGPLFRNQAQQHVYQVFRQEMEILMYNETLPYPLDCPEKFFARYLKRDNM